MFVGVSKYNNYDGAMDLKAPEPNTVKLKDLFKTFRFTKDNIPVERIETLVNENATKQGILDAILETFKDANENDVSYFYYMGHGGVRNGDPIITAADHKYTDYSTMITVHELKATLDQIKGHKVILLETCHGGNFIERGARALAWADFDEKIVREFAKLSRETLNKGDYQVITSSAGDQYSWENSWTKISYFCHPFIMGCKDLKADYDEDGVVTLDEIHNYTTVWIAKQSLPEKQEPQIYPIGSEFPVAEY
ncbi:MAG: caspase family protein [Bacteroidales bacterium]